MMHPFCCISTINSEQRKQQHHQMVSTAPASPGPALAKFLDMPEPGPPSKLSNDEAALMKINELVGNGISGILFKWVNYGKGWRPRWFVLQDGVLSYYKIHGRHKIVVNQETEKGAAIIGERSFRKISRSDRSPYSQSLQRRPFGEIHLKVSSTRESRSDDRRFSINTGTKMLHLRAETREDRMAWIEALEVARDMFPRLSNSDHLMSEMPDVVMSTEKLRQRLLDEGVSENAVDDCEQIMKSEFSVWRNRLLLLKQQLLLVDTLRHLESDKVDLEYTVVDENHSQAQSREASTLMGQVKSSDGSLSELEDENEWHAAGEEDMDDDDNNFLDSRDFLSSSSVRSVESDAQSSLSDSDNELPHTTEDENIGGSRLLNIKYNHVRRRKKLPNPVEKEKGVSLWSMIKDNIGKDLTKVCLPVYFNEPLSSLQKCFEDFEYSYLLDQAYEWGKRGNHLMRALNVAAFAVSGYASTDGRTCKPFNPLLGETYEADFPDKGLHFISEKVSHHPMIIACHCEGRGWKLFGDSNLKSKFWGRSIQLEPTGTITLEFEDGEVFQWSKVTTSIYNLILGKLYCDHYGTMRIQGNRDYSCKMKFKEQSIIDRNPHQVQGFVQDKTGKVVATLFGKWDESMFYMDGEASRKMKESADSEPDAHLLWRRSKPPKFPTRYNLTRFAITLNEMTPGLQDELPPTDSRLRPDQRFLEKGEFEMAFSEKLRLEQRQRQAGKMQEMGWKPRWFAKEHGGDTYRYAGGYWEAREKRTWESCPDIFGHAFKDHTSPL